MSTKILSGYDSAIVGFTTGSVPCAVYDMDKIVAILMERDGMTEDDAIEFYEYNIEGSYLGEGGPVFINRMTLDVFEQTM